MRYTPEPSSDSTSGCLYKLAETLKKEGARNQAIAAADPLQSDEGIQRLPALNEQRDTEGIKEALEQILATAQCLPEFNFIHCSAAIRDISMFGGSLVRFGIEPMDCVSGFSEVLLHLSAKVDAHIPRDSFIDYSSRNPADRRERRFTSLPQEGIFIDSLRQGMASLDLCLKDMMNAYTYPLSHQECAAYYRSAADNFQTMTDSIVRVKRTIPPEVFTHHIRPFFEPFRVGDTAFSAPSGAEMPILNIDQMIWGADCEEDLYSTYFQANIIRLPAIYQEISLTLTGQKSLVSILKNRLTYGPPFSAKERVSIQEIHHLLTKMYSFRMAHYKVAEENVILRQQETAGIKEVKGSSGFGIVETKYVLDQTIKSRQITAEALSLLKEDSSVR